MFCILCTLVRENLKIDYKKDWFCNVTTSRCSCILETEQPCPLEVSQFFELF